MSGAIELQSIWFLAAIAAVIAILLAIRLIVGKRRALPVLMYHKVDPQRRDRLTVSTDQFAQQLEWLTKHGYRTITLHQLMEANEQGRRLTGRNVLLTYDDAYVNTLTHALPILQRFGMSAVLFVPSAFIGGTNEWDGGDEALMDKAQLQQLTPTFELALHSHRHPNYRHLTGDEIRTDIAENLTAMQATGLPYLPAFAYPYGGRPKERKARSAMHDALQQAGIKLAFRIGGRLNPVPLRAPYAVQRLDINGTDGVRSFSRKVRLGKLL